CEVSESDRLWQAATAIEQDDANDEEAAQVVVNASGTATAVWRRRPRGKLQQIWASRYAPDTKLWSAPLRIGPESGSGDVGAAAAPQVAITDNGDAVAVWAQVRASAENGVTGVWEAGYTGSGGWSTA